MASKSFFGLASLVFQDGDERFVSAIACSRRRLIVDPMVGGKRYVANKKADVFNIDTPF